MGFARSPDSMKNLEGPIKEKAIDIANKLVEEDYEEGRAISIGIAQAKKWVGEQTPPQHLVPHPSGWAIRGQKAKKVSYVFKTKAEALKKAQTVASNQETRLIIHRKDGSIERQQSFAR
jgi:uncharacterized protein YdaT